MDKNVKALWLNALRSGEYEQGKGALEAVEEDGRHTFCCLGVLCDVATKNGIVLTKEVEFSDELGFVVTSRAEKVVAYNGRNDFPPDEVAEWAGIDPNLMVEAPEGGVDVYEAGELVPVSVLNDDADFTFAQIADLIEVSA